MVTSMLSNFQGTKDVTFDRPFFPVFQSQARDDQRFAALLAEIMPRKDNVAQASGRLSSSTQARAMADYHVRLTTRYSMMSSLTLVDFPRLSIHALKLIKEVIWHVYTNFSRFESLVHRLPLFYSEKHILHCCA